MAEIDDKNFERAREYIVVAESRAAKKQAHRGQHEGYNEAAFFLVKSGRNEQPHLKQDEGRRENCSADQRNLQVEIQRVHGMSEDERLADARERCLNEIHKPVVEGPDSNEADSQVDGGVDDALPKLIQVLHQAHARQFRALAYGCPRLADCFPGIKHGGPPAPLLTWAAPAGYPVPR